MLVEDMALSFRDSVLVEEDDFKVRTRNYTDPEIFNAEMKNIFGKVWVYIGHESEIPAAGDFKTTAIGRTPVILCRDNDGKLNVLLNACRHRANAVCREERGNTQHFECPYHGWMYKTSGELAAVPMRDGFPPSFDVSTKGLIRIPRVQSFRGLIFASLNKDVESLEDYLAPVAEHIHAWADQSLDGELRISTPHKYAYDGNWKFQAENGNDGYHVGFTHQSAFKTLAKFLPSFKNKYARRNSNSQGLGYTVGSDMGHGILGLRLQEGDTRRMSRPVFEDYLAALERRHGPERARDILGSRHVFIFPNVFLMDVNIRVIQPISASKTAVYSHYVSVQGAPDVLNSERMLDLQRRLGTVGMIGPDDVEMFAANQSGMEAAEAGLEWIFFSRGLHVETTGPHGERIGNGSSETPQRAFHLGWRRCMG